MPRSICASGAIVRCAIAVALHASSALADEPSPDAQATAHELFVQGRALVDQKDYEHACPKLEESQRLDPGGGTLLNLALCHELSGRTATAWVEFAEAMRVAKRDGRADREEFARSHVEALEARLSRLRVAVPQGTRVAGLVVERDGAALGEATWNEAVPVDPGTHVIRATAPAKLPVRIEIAVGTEHDTQTVTLPALADALPVSTPANGVARGDLPRPWPTRRWVGVGVAAAGLVAVGVGSFFGLKAIDLKNRALDACPSRAQCTADGEATNNNAKMAADLSTGLFLGGIAAAGAGVLLFFLSTPEEPRVASRGPLPFGTVRW
jgi:hypothetical protein